MNMIAWPMSGSRYHFLTTRARKQRNSQHRSTRRRGDLFGIIPLRVKHIIGKARNHFYVQALTALASQELIVPTRAKSLADVPTIAAKVLLVEAPQGVRVGWGLPPSSTSLLSCC